MLYSACLGFYLMSFIFHSHLGHHIHLATSLFMHLLAMTVSRTFLGFDNLGSFEVFGIGICLFFSQFGVKKFWEEGPRGKIPYSVHHIVCTIPTVTVPVDLDDPGVRSSLLGFSAIRLPFPQLHAALLRMKSLCAGALFHLPDDLVAT